MKEKAIELLYKFDSVICESIDLAKSAAILHCELMIEELTKIDTELSIEYNYKNSKVYWNIVHYQQLKEEIEKL